MRLLHFADLHLDTLFRWAPPELARARRRALRSTLTRICRLAAELRADALCCGGDLFEQKRFTPDTAHPHDHNAIAVFVNGLLAGYLSREIAGTVQPALIAFTAASSGRNVASPARILWRDIDNQPTPQVILSLDPAPFGLPAQAFDQVPELDRIIQQHLRRLDAAAPAMTGYDPAARSKLAAAEAQRSQTEADFGRSATAWSEVEHAFLQVIPRLVI